MRRWLRILVMYIRAMYVASDSHEGLKHAVAKVLPMALWQRCAVHFLRNAYDHASHQTDPACLADLKRMWSCTDMVHARHELQIWLQRWGDEPGCIRMNHRSMSFRE